MMLFMSIDVFEMVFFFCWSIQTILYYLSFFLNASLRVDLLFVLVSFHLHHKLWTKSKAAFFGVIFEYLLVIVGVLVLAFIFLPGCVDYRSDTISLFGINRARSLIFTKYKLKKIGDQETKDRISVDLEIILRNGTFDSRATNILVNMVESNRHVKGIMDEDWTLHVLNNTVKNGLIQIACDFAYF